MQRVETDTTNTSSATQAVVKSVAKTLDPRRAAADARYEKMESERKEKRLHDKQIQATTKSMPSSSNRIATTLPGFNSALTSTIASPSTSNDVATPPSSTPVTISTLSRMIPEAKTILISKPNSILEIEPEGNPALFINQVMISFAKHVNACTEESYPGVVNQIKQEIKTYVEKKLHDSTWVKEVAGIIQREGMESSDKALLYTSIFRQPLVDAGVLNILQNSAGKTQIARAQRPSSFPADVSGQMEPSSIDKKAFYFDWHQTLVEFKKDIRGEETRITILKPMVVETLLTILQLGCHIAILTNGSGDDIKPHLGASGLTESEIAKFQICAANCSNGILKGFKSAELLTLALTTFSDAKHHYFYDDMEAFCEEVESLRPTLEARGNTLSVAQVRDKDGNIRHLIHAQNSAREQMKTPSSSPVLPPTSSSSSKEDSKEIKEVPQFYPSISKKDPIVDARQLASQGNFDDALRSIFEFLLLPENNSSTLQERTIDRYTSMMLRDFDITLKPMHLALLEAVKLLRYALSGDRLEQLQLLLLAEEGTTNEMKILLSALYEIMYRPSGEQADTIAALVSSLQTPENVSLIDALKNVIVTNSASIKPPISVLSDTVFNALTVYDSYFKRTHVNAASASSSSSTRSSEPQATTSSSIGVTVEASLYSYTKSSVSPFGLFATATPSTVEKTVVTGNSFTP